VNPTVIKRFLPGAHEMINTFACDRKNCNNYAENIDATVQNLAGAWNLCTRKLLLIPTNDQVKTLEILTDS
jgi:hypothetical protein